MPESSARRCPDRHRLARFQYGLIAAFQHLDPVGAAHPCRADFAGGTAEEPVGTNGAVRGEDGAVHPLEETNGALGAAPRTVLAGWRCAIGIANDLPLTRSAPPTTLSRLG